jgi:pimeloyl-ACP methyl ester carboxylesterase
VTEFARRLDGVRIAYDFAAGEHPVLLVHGFGSDAAVTWHGTGWVRALSEAGRASVTPDLRGHGRSDKPHRSADYAPRQLAADLVAVLDQLELEEVDVIGYSMGARVSAALTQLAPERVHKLVVGGAGPLELFETWDMEEMSRFLAGDGVPADATIAAVLGAAIDAGADPEALAACVQGVAGARLDVAPSIPTLYVAGGADRIPDGVEEIARARGAEYLELPGRTHINALTSRQFKTAALEFLAP